MTLTQCSPPQRTFVFRVRFNTSPDLMMRSNSKLPFCVTGESVSNVRPLFLRFCIDFGNARLLGGEAGFKVLPGMGLGWLCAATSAMAGSFVGPFNMLVGRSVAVLLDKETRR